MTKGPIVYALQKYDFLVIFPINPATLAKYRVAFKPSRAKDDPTDAEMGLDLLLHHPERFKPLQPQSVAMRTLLSLTEHRRELVDDKTRLTNRLTDIRLAHSGDADRILVAANEILATRIKHGDALGSPGAVRDYLRLALSGKEHEVFIVVLLDAQNRVLAAEELFRGTLTQTSVYPREVVKSALKHNAAGVVLAHNHPSGVAEPSHADQLLTTSLKQALALVDIKVLDHFIVAGGSALSFAERGLL